MTSLPVKVLISTAAVTALYALIADMRKQKQVRQLAARMQEQYRDKWLGLPWLHRAMPRVGLRIIFRSSAVDDPESLDRYQRLCVAERRQMAALAVCALAIAVVLFGTRFWGWIW